MRSQGAPISDGHRMWDIPVLTDDDSTSFPESARCLTNA